VENFEVILQNHIYVYPRIEAKDRTGQVLSSEGKLRFKKSPKSTFNWRPIVEISSTFIRKSIKEGKHSASFTD
jgi:nicotinate-nucleotide adenylyltransferase